MKIWTKCKLSQEFSFSIEVNCFFNRCDFNKYTIRVIKKISESKIKSEVRDEDEDMNLISKDSDESSDEMMSDDDTSEE